MNINHDRRDFMKKSGLGLASLTIPGCKAADKHSNYHRNSESPNIIYIMADDLGYAELGCYGQDKIQTPNIDRLASQGMKFTQHYSGNPVCAPSRCSLMTGLHTGHTQIRGNKQVGGKEGWQLGSTIGGQYPIKEDTVTVAKLLQQKGYKTGAFGKWGLGTYGSSGAPDKQGFDHFYGYICQRQAHTYYPNHLWCDGQVEWLDDNKDGKENNYSHDLIAEKALQFIRKNQDKPFFCYVPFTIPHVALQAPEDSLQEYKGKWPETPFKGSATYSAQENPRACYAAMVTRMDRSVGQIMTLLDELGLAKNTLVIFTSDNGPTFNGGSDSVFFESAKPLRGLKASVYEGGVRIPFVARWPGKIKPGSSSDHISAFWDFLPTSCEIAGITPPTKIDGISILPTLLGKKAKQKKHKYLYWELRNQQAIRMGDWKAIRFLKKDMKDEFHVYNLKEDIGEKHDLVDKNPEITAVLKELMDKVHVDSDIFPLVRR